MMDSMTITHQTKHEMQHIILHAERMLQLRWANRFWPFQSFTAVLHYLTVPRDVPEGFPSTQWSPKWDREYKIICTVASLIKQQC